MLDPLHPHCTRILNNRDLDTNIGGGIWSTVEVQVGFICANLPHTCPLAIRLYQRWRGHIGASYNDGSHQSVNGYGSSDIQNRSHRNTVGFQLLGSGDNPMAGLAGPVAETDLETADFSYPNVSFRKYALDRDLTLLEQPYDGNQRSVQV